MSNTPVFSFVIPTRDRPQVLQYALKALKASSFQDFEVIVVDNFVMRSSEEVVEALNDPRFKRIVPRYPLNMIDNWEEGIKHAIGEYVSYQSDKTFPLPFTMERTVQALEKYPAEIVSWHYLGINPDDDMFIKSKSCITAAFPIEDQEPEYFDPLEKLRWRMSHVVPRGAMGKDYHLGKIVFGAYHRDLIKRIIERTGHLFEAVNPDYTSMVPALALAKSALDMKRYLSYGINVTYGGGGNGIINCRVGLQHYQSIDPSLKILDRLPIPGVYCSHHNAVAHDYIIRSEQALGAAASDFKFGYPKLIRYVAEDLSQTRIWGPPEEEPDQKGRVVEYARRYDVDLSDIPEFAAFL